MFHFRIPLLCDFSYFSTRREKISRKRDNEKKCESKQYCAKVHLHLGTLQTKLFRFANKDYNYKNTPTWMWDRSFENYSTEFLFHLNFYCNFPFWYNNLNSQTVLKVFFFKLVDFFCQSSSFLQASLLTYFSSILFSAQWCDVFDDRIEFYTLEAEKLN